MRLPFLTPPADAQDTTSGDALSINTQTLHQYYNTVVDHGEGPVDPISQAIERRAKRMSRLRALRAQLVNALGFVSVALLLSAGWALARTL